MGSELPVSVSSRVALVTGASRGVGAEVARQLAAPGTHVIVHGRQDSHQAQAVADDIVAAGGHASTALADIADEDAVTEMINAIGRRFGHLDLLVLNASTTAANRIAQRRLARLALPLMPAGGQIVFVTNNQAHFFPHKAVPKGYTSMAASMREGETTLHAMRSEFRRHGIEFTVVSGEILSGRRSTSLDVAVAVTGAAQTHHAGIVYVRHPQLQSA